MKLPSHIKTPADFLANLSEERRREVKQVHAMVRRNIPDGFDEMLLWGCIGWAIPLLRYPDTYNRQPLCYVALGSSKSYCTLHLMGCYGDGNHRRELDRAFADAGKKMDMGQACLHFQTADDLPLDAIGKLIAAITPERWIEIYEKSRLLTKSGKAKAAKAAKAKKTKR